MKRLLLPILLSLNLIPVSSVQINLDSANNYQWEAALPNRSIVVPGRVPGNIYSDLYDAGGILTNGPFYFRYNDLDYRWVAKNDWTYSLTFNVDGEVLSHSGVFLVFHGVDTASSISLNGVPLAETNNMFIRYRFDVKALLQAGANNLVVNLRSPINYSTEKYEEQLVDYLVPPACQAPETQGECHANHIRKVQSSFSWDWGPAFPSVGLWKTVTLEAYDTLIVRDVMVTTTPSDSQWLLDLTLHCETADSGTTHTGTWSFEILDKDGAIISQFQQDSSLTGSQDRLASVAVQTAVDSSAVEKWMPNGYGSQTLYRIRISYTENGASEVLKEVRFGFRTVSLVEDDLPNGGRTFYFKVNDEPVYLKGSNWIPAHVLPELGLNEYHHLLESSRKAHMNVLRVWGGGQYELDEFYDLADELGILIWQDFMFACSMYPVREEFLDIVRTETRQQIRRLQRHPSLLIWAGNNENEAALRGNWYGTNTNFDLYKRDYITLYVDTVRPIIYEEDSTRSFIVSSPTNGKRSEEEGYISQNPYDNLYGDTHHYNYNGDAWDWTKYPRPRMASEYGFQSLPSIHAWTEVTNPRGQGDDWFYNSSLLLTRQHHPNGNEELTLQVANRLGNSKAADPEENFIDMIYLTQMHQAQAMKTQTEHYRRFRYIMQADGVGFNMGALYWQLNDIWQAPSWASIEFGGRWKPLHYFAIKFFAPLTFLTVQLEDGYVGSFLHYDRKEDMFPGILEVRLYSWSKLQPVYFHLIPVSMNTPVGFPVWYTNLEELLAANNCSKETCFITTSYRSDFGEVLGPDNYMLLASFPSVTNLQEANVQISTVSDVYQTVQSQWTFNITLTTDNVAAFVWLDTISGSRGTFSDNGFLLSESEKTVVYWSSDPVTDSAALAADLRLKHLAQVIL